MNRHVDWGCRLNQYLNKIKDKPFRMGRHDCCTLVAGAVEAMTGEDPMADWPKYKNWKEAEDTLSGSSLYNELRKRFGDPVNGAKGHQGDIAYHDKSCGIIIGKRVMFFGKNGYVMMPISHLQKAFRVPF